MRYKKYIIGLLLLISTVSLFGCEDTLGSDRLDLILDTEMESVSSEVNEEKQEEIKKEIEDSFIVLNEASEITVKAKYFSVRNSYTIYVDDVEFGDVTGKYFKALGDTFTFSNIKETKLSSESQIKRWDIKLNRLAEVYDYNDNIIGYIGEEVFKDLFKLGYTFHFYDKDKNEIGICKQEVFKFSDTFDIYDNDDNKCYVIEEKLASWSNEYYITVYDNSTIPTDQAIYLTCILDSIKEADKATKESERNED